MPPSIMYNESRPADTPPNADFTQLSATDNELRILTRACYSSPEAAITFEQLRPLLVGRTVDSTLRAMRYQSAADAENAGVSNLFANPQNHGPDDVMSTIDGVVLHYADFRRLDPTNKRTDTVTIKIPGSGEGSVVDRTSPRAWINDAVSPIIILNI